MIFTQDEIRKYQDLCRDHFKEEVDEQTAARELTDLVYLVSLIYRPLTPEQIQNINEMRKFQASQSSNGKQSKDDR